MFNVSEAYREREIEPLGVLEEAGWRLKLYSVRYGETKLDRPIYDLGLKLAMEELPDEAVADDRPGVGFVIFHQGRGVHYLVLGWWGLENELFIRVYVREFGRSAKWRRAVDRGVACVWDLKVIWHERQAYVQHVLSRPDAPDLDGYVADAMVQGSSAPPPDAPLPISTAAD